MKPAILLPLAACWSLAGTPTVAGWNGTYACSFTQECIGTDRPCTQGTPLEATLSRKGAGWVLTGDGETGIAFREIGRFGAPLLSLISTQSDPAASAVTLLSVAQDGAAFVSTHGIFLEPGAVLHVGTCTAGTQ